DEFEIEEKPFLAKVLRAEAIRKGTINLFKDLESDGHEIWIYTTSFRSASKIRKTCWCYGLRIGRIINGQANQIQLQRHQCSASKNPKLFGIDMHIDDSQGVEIEGVKYGFATIIISEHETNWTSPLLLRIKDCLI